MKSRTLMPVTVLLIIASLATGAYAQFSIMHNFGTKAGDPENPTWSGIIAQGRDGSLYSTTPAGSLGNEGV